MLKRATEIPTIDTSLVTLKTEDGTEIALDTASKIGIEPQIETQEAIKLIIKNKLRAQKPEQSTLTGNRITLSDNVFTPELVQILQGGKIQYWTSAEHTAMQDEPTTFGIAKYTPPITGSGERGKSFTLCAYSAQYDTSGEIIQYEKITYPNCKGVPVAFGTEDDVFRIAEYTINSAPNKNQAPYEIEYLKELPKISE